MQRPPPARRGRRFTAPHRAATSAFPVPQAAAPGRGRGQGAEGRGRGCGQGAGRARTHVAGGAPRSRAAETAWEGEVTAKARGKFPPQCGIFTPWGGTRWQPGSWVIFYEGRELEQPRCPVCRGRRRGHGQRVGVCACTPCGKAPSAVVTECRGHAAAVSRCAARVPPGGWPSWFSAILAS